MANPTTFAGEVQFLDAVLFDKEITFNQNTIAGTAISSSSPVPANALTHRNAFHWSVPGVVTAQDIFFGPFFNTTTIDRFQAVLATAPTGGDTITVDLQKWNGTTWATVLSAPLSFASGDGAMARKIATVAGGASVSATESMKVVVTRTGTTGSNLFGVARTSESGGL